MEQFIPHASSPGFDPDVHLKRIGVANQTTMLARESLAIGEEVGAAMERARGAEARASDFRTFDTICSATQERQDAVLELLKEPLDLMIVIGGFNSSNTISLAALCAERAPTYHIESVHGIDPSRLEAHTREIKRDLLGGLMEKGGIPVLPPEILSVLDDIPVPALPLVYGYARYSGDDDEWRDCAERLYAKYQQNEM